MKNNLFKKLASWALAAICLFSVVACVPEQKPEPIDYAGQVKLDLTSETKKQEVTVKNFIDGDTTHFYLPSGAAVEHAKSNVLKARYLAVNTPESTGKIEEWGKAASNFTKEKLSSATSIILETDGSNWEVDSTGERHLVWVWYKPSETADYRCLNIELLQNGLALGSKAGDTRYGEACTNAINMASELKLKVFSEESDPGFYYGSAINVNLRDLRTHLDEYAGTDTQTPTRVSFEGIVIGYSSQGVYVQSYDEDTQRYYAIYAYYGFGSLNPLGVKVLDIGNHVRIVGSVQYWEAGDSYQISDLSYDARDKENLNHIKKLDNEKHEIVYTEVDAETFYSDVTLDIQDEDQASKTYTYRELALSTALSMKNLQVVDVYTTKNQSSDDYGAITLTCKADGKTIYVRTVPLYDENMELIKEDTFVGKTIDVKGILDYYKNTEDEDAEGQYQIKAFSMDDIVIH